VAQAVERVEATAALRAVVGRLARLLRQAGASGSLTPTQISVLFTICRLGPLPLGTLAEHEMLNPTMLSRVIGGLADAGLLARSAAPGDRRSALVEATPAGRSLRTRIHEQRNAALAGSLAELTPEQRSAIEAAVPALEALAERLR